MSKEKRDFKKIDWSKLTYEEVIENIEYLLKHCKEYEITQRRKNVIYIDNVCLLKGCLKDRTFVSIDGKYYADSISKFDICVLLEKLFDKCEQEIKTRKYINKEIKKAERYNKLKKWWNDNQVGFFIVFFVVVMGSSLVGAAWHEQKKQNKIENKVKEYGKTLPNYSEYEKVVYQLQKYRDSLECASK